MEKIAREKFVSKIVCIALALILWFYVSYQENPSMSKTVRNVPLAITGEQALKENGFSVYSVSEKSVDVKATAKRLTLARISNKTLSAVINVSSIKESGTYVIPATVSSAVSSSANYYVKGKDISVIIEPILEKDFSVEADFSSDIGSSLMLHSSSLSADKVTVTAPQSILADIASVKTETILPSLDTAQKSAKLVVYGNNGKILEGAQCSPSEVNVTYSLFEVKSVPVILKTDEGKTFSLPAQNSVKICGIGEEFDRIEQIETVPVSLKGLEANSTVRVKLEIPSGIVLQSGSDKIDVELKEKYFKK